MSSQIWKNRMDCNVLCLKTFKENDKTSSTPHPVLCTCSCLSVLVCTGTTSDCFLSFVAAQVPTCWGMHFILLSVTFIFLYIISKPLYHLKKKKYRLPWWLSDKESIGNMRSITDPGGFHMCRATKAVHHNYWASAPEPVLCNKRSHRSKPRHCS